MLGASEMSARQNDELRARVSTNVELAAGRNMRGLSLLRSAIRYDVKDIKSH